ncbi:hypothetical protein A9Q91_03645 [Candidatus Gracilibacteria bacterium 28_42_T64]|nr:hypothetical protein A9Q91_03645 [Candidatus Gracilibacteria bacterium 28_42_T64]
MALVDREGNNQGNQEINENTIIQKPKMGLFSKLKYIFIACIAIFVVGTISVGFYTATHTQFIDNPTGSGITVQIDDMEVITIAAYSNEVIRLGSGQYTVKMNGEIVGNFEKKSLDTKSLLNPTGGIYISEYMLYGEEEYIDKLPNNTIEAYGNVAEGPFEQYEGLYITGNWNYGTDESFPEEVELRKSKAYKIKSKLYRFDDFVDMYNEYYVDNSAEITEENVEK